MLKKAFITGGNGFIGSALVNNLVRNQYEVTVLLRNDQSNIGLLPVNEISLIYGEISVNLVNEIINRDFDVFFHLAWSGVSGDTRKDMKTQLDNVNNSITAVELASLLACKRFVGAGSIMEDESLILAQTQGKPLPTQYLYGAAKLSAHLFTKTKADELGIDHLWPKITNTFGPGEISARFINTTLRKILNDERLEFTAGTQNYDFIYIDDVANALRLVAEKGLNNKEYIIGSGKAQALRKYVESLHHTVDTKLSLNFGDIPYKGVNLSLDHFDVKPLFEDTGFMPKVSFEEGIRRTFEWIKGDQNAKI